MTTDLNKLAEETTRLVYDAAEDMQEANNYILSALQQVQAEAAGEWISAKDKLPKLREYVQVYSPTRLTGAKIQTAALSVREYPEPLGPTRIWSDWTTTNGGNKVFDLLGTFWRPLPQPPVKE